MPQSMTEGERQALWEALRRRVCTVCLDSRDGGECGLSGRVCALENHFGRIIQAVAGIESPRMDDYVRAIESDVCGRCAEQDPDGYCSRREHGECALNLYLPLVVEAIEEVRGPLGHESAR